MAEKTLKIYASGSAVVKSSAPKTHFSASQMEELAADTNKYLVVVFDAVPSAYQFCRLNEKYVDGYIYTLDVDGTQQLKIKRIDSEFDIDTVTLDDISDEAWLFGSGIKLYSTSGAGYKEFGTSDSGDVLPALRNGILVYSVYRKSLIVHTASGSNPPYFELTVDTADKVGLYITAASPTSGYIDRTKESVFRWSARPDGECYADVVQSGGMLVWQVGDNGEAHSIDVGTATSCTVPANTFPAATADIRWQVQLQANSGVETVSKWYSITTADATPAAKTQSPINTILDGSVESTFRWTHTTATGTAQTAYDLQYSTDGSTWVDMASGSGSETSAVIPAGTFPAGTIYWRVRTYNQDAVASEWSDAAEIIVISAPGTPGVTVEEASPRPVLQWSSLGQQGFEVEIGNYHSGVTFGADQRWQCPELLEDGEYIARVRVINTYGLWSDWGAAPMTISHTAGAAITLYAEVSHTADLSWNTDGAYDRYMILRDGVPIGRTKDRSFRDDKSIGSVTYQIVGLPAEGWDYGVSDLASVHVSTDTLMLCDLTTGEWHELRLTDQQHRTITEALTQTVARVNLSGRAYPVAEKTPWRNRSVTVTWAGVDTDTLSTYDALLGKKVVVKTPGGRMAYGIVDSLQRIESVFYTTYSAELWQLDDTEVIDYDP